MSPAHRHRDPDSAEHPPGPGSVRAAYGGCYLTGAAVQVVTRRAGIPLQEWTSRCADVIEVDRDTLQRTGLR